MSNPVDPQEPTPAAKTLTKKPSNTARRSFLKAGTAASASLVAGLTTVRPVRGAEPQNASEEPVRIGLVGAGGRGAGAINDSLTINENVTLSAIADVEEGKLESVRKVSDQIFEDLKDQYSAHFQDSLELEDRMKQLLHLDKRLRLYVRSRAL